MIQESISFKYEPASVPQHISVKWNTGVLVAADSFGLDYSVLEMNSEKSSGATLSTSGNATATS